MIVRILLLFIALFTFGAQAQAIKESYAFAVLGEPWYAFNFNHFDYVNPAAPKGGQITLSALGTFDNFNRYALRGNPAHAPSSCTTRYLRLPMTNQAVITR